MGFIPSLSPHLESHDLSVLPMNPPPLFQAIVSHHRGDSRITSRAMDAKREVHGSGVRERHLAVVVFVWYLCVGCGEIGWVVEEAMSRM